ncbi:MAG: dihydropteroate synthase [Selenomonadaceae bacterium]|nr:dihydropteroate synthase [Selenomonadaceae bacterium]
MKLELGRKTLIMGILNVTPDSFSDGGIFYSTDAALRHAEEMLRDGADIIDIGAESTRPGFTPVDAQTEIARLEKILPAVKNLGAVVSVDTSKPEVAEWALNYGADILNDVSGRMVDVAKKFSAPIVLMHNQKISSDVVYDIKNFFRRNLRDDVQIIFDVGIGFGKTQEENLTVLRNLRELKKIDGIEIPLLLGVSRKSVIGYAAGFEVDQRDEATGAICVLAIEQGVNIVRVHNVKMAARMYRMADILVREGLK